MLTTRLIFPNNKEKYSPHENQKGSWQKHPSVETAAWGWNQISAIPTENKREIMLHMVG